MLLSSSQGPFSLVHTMVLTRFRLAVCLGNMADGVHSTYFPFWLLPLCERRTNAGSITKRNISSCNRHGGLRLPRMNSICSALLSSEPYNHQGVESRSVVGRRLILSWMLNYTLDTLLPPSHANRKPWAQPVGGHLLHGSSSSFASRPRPNPPKRRSYASFL